MTKPGIRAAFGLVLLALAAPAAAQPRSFVEAGLLADYDPTLRSDTSTTAGITGSAGFFVSRRWSLRAEIEYPQWHSTRSSHQGRVQQRIEAGVMHEERRAPSISVLVGRDMRPDSRVGVSLLAGLTATRRDSKRAGSSDTFDLEGNLIEHRDFAFRSRGYTWYAVSAGSDVTIALTKRLALVPQIRVHSYPYSEHTSLLFVRPRVSLRFNF